ncbi:MAG: hypothetical protein KatS3mg034_1690 [Vicingaceae bacterium]|nr:MAG: hypothetical protein KatS3mg034_1690 [Vicingaceae bacterium]
MLRFIKHHMETIAGIEIFPLISFGIFFIFFVVVLVWLWKMDKSYVNKMKKLPLD